MPVKVFTSGRIRQADYDPASSILFWRRTDIQGLERMEIDVARDAVTARSTLLCMEDGGLRLDATWDLDPAWRVQGVTLERWNAQGHAMLRVERAGSGWRVQDAVRPDLDGAEEPDLSLTPFCNTLAIRRVPQRAGAALTLDTAFIDGAALTVARSRQRYERLAPDRLRYVDLGLSAGFEAELVVDGEGLVLHYQHLFERVPPAV